MDPEFVRACVADLVAGLRGTFLEDRLVLGGSSGLFGFPTGVPPFTEDIDFLVEEVLVASRGAEVVETLELRGFRREPGSPTFLRAGGPSFDLVGYSKTDFTDHLSPEGPLRVMVFGELGRILLDPESVERGIGGVLCLGPAGFVAAKLLTLRVEKGAKDKLQALLVVAERGGRPEFRRALARILKGFGEDRVVDVLADAQAALLCLERDPGFRDRGTERYAEFVREAGRGYAALIDILEGGPL